MLRLGTRRVAFLLGANIILIIINLVLTRVRAIHTVQAVQAGYCTRTFIPR